MVWFLERDSELIVCEIRRAADNESEFEFEMAAGDGPTTLRFGAPADLIRKYLYEHGKLLADGWRPRSISTID
jgi:hypothetical protein